MTSTKTDIPNVDNSIKNCIQKLKYIYTSNIYDVLFNMCDIKYKPNYDSHTVVSDYLTDSEINHITKLNNCSVKFTSSVLNKKNISISSFNDDNVVFNFRYFLSKSNSYDLINDPSKNNLLNELNLLKSKINIQTGSGDNSSTKIDRPSDPTQKPILAPELAKIPITKQSEPIITKQSEPIITKQSEPTDQIEEIFKLLNTRSEPDKDLMKTNNQSDTVFDIYKTDLELYFKLFDNIKSSSVDSMNNKFLEIKSKLPELEKLYQLYNDTNTSLEESVNGLTNTENQLSNAKNQLSKLENLLINTSGTASGSASGSGSGSASGTDLQTKDKLIAKINKYQKYIKELEQSTLELKTKITEYEKIITKLFNDIIQIIRSLTDYAKLQLAIQQIKESEQYFLNRRKLIEDYKYSDYYILDIDLLDKKMNRMINTYSFEFDNATLCEVYANLIVCLYVNFYSKI